MSGREGSVKPGPEEGPRPREGVRRAAGGRRQRDSGGRIGREETPKQGGGEGRRAGGRRSRRTGGRGAVPGPGGGARRGDGRRASDRRPRPHAPDTPGRRHETGDRRPATGQRSPSSTGAEERGAEAQSGGGRARPVLNVRGLRTYFPVKTGAFNVRRLMVRAVDDVSLQLRGGETLGLVGESGCGKTTLGRSVLRLYRPQGGRVYLEPDPELVRTVTALDTQADTVRQRAGELAGAGWRERRLLRVRERRLRDAANRRAAAADLLAMPRAPLKQARRRLQMVFQDPWASLNPRMLVHDLIAEGPREFGTHAGSDLEVHVRRLMDRVGLPRSAAQRYPHEFSGGQRQRIGIARALAPAPSVVIADEPVSALDVSIQAQILNLLIELQEELGLTYLFIAHDLAVVRYIADRVAVMYLGKIVEFGDAEEITEQPRHPYTISLMASVPVADPDQPLAGGGAPGDVPSPVNPPSGCPFHPRCPHRIDACTRTMPDLVTDRHGHALACHNPPPTDRS